MEVEGASVATSAAQAGGHLHLYVDGQLQQMPYSTATEVALRPGEHVITVELVDLQHVSFDPPVEASVSVRAED